MKTSELAEWLHEKYEEQAQESGWETQDGTSVPFEELPVKNQLTMLGVAAELKQKFEI